jgi:hypothetical protein
MLFRFRGAVQEAAALKLPALNVTDPLRNVSVIKGDFGLATNLFLQLCHIPLQFPALLTGQFLMLFAFPEQTHG